MLVCKPSEGEFCLCASVQGMRRVLWASPQKPLDTETMVRAKGSIYDLRVHELNRSSISHRIGNRARLEWILVWKYNSSLEISWLTRVIGENSFCRLVRWNWKNKSTMKKYGRVFDLIKNELIVSFRVCVKKVIFSKQLSQNLMIKVHLEGIQIFKDGRFTINE